MNVDFNSWHAKLYRLHHKMKDGWEPSAYYGSNLCPYMRTVLFYWWLRWLFIDGKIKVGNWNIPVPIPVALIIFFFGPGWLGMFSYNLKCLMYGVDCLAVLVLTVFGIIGLFVLIKNRVKKSKFHDAVLEPVAEATSGFAHLLVDYGKSFHDKICPSIEFVDKTNPPVLTGFKNTVTDADEDSGTPADLGCS